MRILFATNHSYIPQMTGGSEYSTHDLCCEFIKHGHEAAVLSSIDKYDFIWLRNRFISKLRKKKFIPDKLVGYPVYRGWDVKKGISDVVSEYKPDIVIVQAGHPFELANAFAELKVPVVFYARDVDFKKNKEVLKKNKLIGFVANSEFTAKKLRDFANVNAVVIPPLIDPEKYLVHDKGNAVVHIGLAAAKGVETSFQLAQKRPDIPFIFLESWPLPNKEFRKYQLRAEQMPNVTVARRKSDMREVYRLCKILLVPSLWDEAWGRVVTEAQLSGIPVIASGRGGLPESVGRGGIIVPPDSEIDEWEKGLSRLWDDKDEYLKLSFEAKSRSYDKDISKDYLTSKLLKFLFDHIEKNKVY